MPRLYNFIFILVFYLTLSSCATHKQTISQRPIKQPRPESPLSSTALPSLQQNPISPDRQVIIQYAFLSIGTKYKWGGQSPEEGFDCSGLIVYAHKKAGIIIPRTTSRQLVNGKIIRSSYRQPADLVFFKNPNKSRGLHVGLYIGDGNFIHAPGKGRKVRIANLGNPYFDSNYIGTRRFAK